MPQACPPARAESIILSAHHTESMILSAPVGHGIMLTAAATKKTKIGNTDDHQSTNLVNSASTMLLIGLMPKGAKFCHTLIGGELIVLAKTFFNIFQFI
jgi:hypothetical protein